MDPNEGIREGEEVNFVVIVADDMRADLLSVMPLTRGMGVSLPHAYVSNPTCGPSRVSMLTGDLSRTTGNYGNNEPNGGWAEWNAAGGEDNTIAVSLDEAGYRCGLMGKYVNGYNPRDVAWVPPGWEKWIAITNGGSAYTDVELSVDGVAASTPPGEYLTDFLANQAWWFIEKAAREHQPFFLWLSPVSPHAEHIPAERHMAVLADQPPHRPPSHDVASTGAKHFANLPPLGDEEIVRIDEVRLDMMRCLLSLDELVARVVQVLSITGVLDDTMLVFTSDNGYMHGEHRMSGKAVPYVESTRAPFVVRMPGAPANPRDLVQTIDIAPSMAAVAGVPFECDGVPVLAQALDHRDWVYIESGVNLPRPTFVQAQGRGHSYTRYSTGEEEFYATYKDPYQLKSRPKPENTHFQEAREFVDEQLAVKEPPGWRD